ncbi:MAG: TetR/AcrR family transcriptional regulator, partial [Mailhella sp.]
MDTKELIMMKALRLFAKEGYEAVSVQDIAGSLGITKGALYKHYRNKRDIFNNIVERMYKIDAERAYAYGVPGETYENEPASYEHISQDSVRKFTMAQFLFWAEDDFASYFRRMIALERYRNAEMNALYDMCLGSGPVLYMADIFRNMARIGVLKDVDAEALALEYYAPFYLLLAMLDAGKETGELVERLRRHIERFMAQNGTEQTGGK